MSAVLQPQVVPREQWRGVSVNERIKAIRSMYVAHSDLLNAEKVIENKIFEIEDAHSFDDEHFQYEDTATYGTGILVIGESGAGKSTFAGRLLGGRPPQRTDTETYLPAVYMRIPSGPTERSMGDALLNAMGHPERSGTANQLRIRCIHLMRKCRVRMLIIDDFQDIPASRTKGIKTLGDWLRTIIDGAPCLVVAMGTPSAAVVRDSNEQLMRRMQATARILPFSVEGTGALATAALKSTLDRWCKLMAAVEAELPMAEASGLTDTDLALRLLMGSNARFGHLSKLLQHGVKVAVAADSERIERTHLGEAFKHTFGTAANHGNPFDQDYDGEPLTKPGQAFDGTKAG